MILTHKAADAGQSHDKMGLRTQNSCSHGRVDSFFGIPPLLFRTVCTRVSLFHHYLQYPVVPRRSQWRDVLRMTDGTVAVRSKAAHLLANTLST